MNIRDLVGEATTYDKKLMLERKEPLSWLKSISAFANTQGGRLIFGVSDDGEYVGLENPEKDAEDLSEIIKNSLDPVPQFDLSFQKESDKTLIVVTVAAGTVTPYYVLLKGHRDAFIRIGNESVKAGLTFSTRSSTPTPLSRRSAAKPLCCPSARERASSP